MTQHTTFIACTYYDLTRYDFLHPLHLNLNVPFAVWGNFSTLKDACNYVNKLRKRKTDTLWGAWDIFQEDWNDEDDYHISWNYNKVVKHYPPRKDHDFFGKSINRLLIAHGAILQ